MEPAPVVPAPVAVPPPVAPSRREKAIEIIDPRTGVSVIIDPHESSSSAGSKSLTKEV